MNELKITGTVTKLLEPQTGESAKGSWTKQEFILETENDKYTKSVCIEIWGDKVDPPQVGDVVVCSINVESREYNGRYYTNVRAWKIDLERSAPDGPVKTEYAKKVESAKAAIPDAEELQGLPF
jgi:hypothetical protein